MRKDVLVLWVPRWSEMAKFGESTFLKTSYIWLIAVPAFARFLSRIEGTKTFQIMQEKWTVELALPFSWQILYMSAVLFSISSALYALFCPRIVREYDSFAEFASRDEGSWQQLLHFSDLLHRCGRWKPHRLGEVTDFATRFFERAVEAPLDKKARILEEYRKHPESILQNVQDLIIRAESMREAFWMIHAFADRSFGRVRMVCGVFYLGGFLLVGLVFFQNFRYVWDRLW